MENKSILTDLLDYQKFLGEERDIIERALQHAKENNSPLTPHWQKMLDTNTRQTLDNIKAVEEAGKKI